MAASLLEEACSSRDCSLGRRERHVRPFLPCHAPALHPGPGLLWVPELPEPGPPGGDREHGAPGACLPSLPEPRCWVLWVLFSPRCLLLPIAELLVKMGRQVANSSQGRRGNAYGPSWVSVRVNLPRALGGL